MWHSQLSLFQFLLLSLGGSPSKFEEKLPYYEANSNLHRCTNVCLGANFPGYTCPGVVCLGALFLGKNKCPGRTNVRVDICPGKKLIGELHYARLGYVVGELGANHLTMSTRN